MKKCPKGVQKSGTLLSGNLRKALNWAKGGDGLAHREFQAKRTMRTKRSRKVFSVLESTPFDWDT